MLSREEFTRRRKAGESYEDLLNEEKLRSYAQDAVQRRSPAARVDARSSMRGITPANTYDRESDDNSAGQDNSETVGIDTNFDPETPIGVQTLRDGWARLEERRDQRNDALRALAKNLLMAGTGVSSSQAANGIRTSWGELQNSYKLNEWAPIEESEYASRQEAIDEYQSRISELPFNLALKRIFNEDAYFQEVDPELVMLEEEIRGRDIRAGNGGRSYSALDRAGYLANAAKDYAAATGADIMRVLAQLVGNDELAEKMESLYWQNENSRRTNAQTGTDGLGLGGSPYKRGLW